MLACIAVAAARPEAAGGYNYQVPSQGSIGILGVGGGLGSLGGGSGLGSLGVISGGPVGNLQSSGGQIHRHVSDLPILPIMTILTFLTLLIFGGRYMCM